eukprot:CAMPEP_0182445060 /NCGR_PEP_ID=MMETSP1172-20130603/3314_1 /TAXON_ID=708627 /ORGANISM="Timspurckia oligopyrenoides, Strain CCMP3278" /LENGTH=272 /DNA_ID=CAMNT_0024640759 /DNA_START=131 /DNA_END=949 /DNA_ORIENTATION=-
MARTKKSARKRFREHDGQGRSSNNNNNKQQRPNDNQQRPLLKENLAEGRVEALEVKVKELEESIKLFATLHKYERLYVFSYRSSKLASYLNFVKKWNADSFCFPVEPNDTKYLHFIRQTLGFEKDNEIATELHRVTNVLAKPRNGILLTNHDDAEVRASFGKDVISDYASAGFDVSEAVVIQNGHLVKPEDSDAELLCTELLEAGVSAKVLESGHIEVLEDFILCEKGNSLSEKSAELARKLDIKLVPNSIELLCHWTRNKHFEEIKLNEVE